LPAMSCSITVLLQNVMLKTFPRINIEIETYRV
jgi:hypothetical protein